VSGARRKLAGQIALVTGGGRGIGREIALALAEAGAVVAVLARGEAELRATAHEIDERGSRGYAITADVTDRQAVNAAAAEVGRELGEVDLLVNNAGALGAVGPPWEVEPEAWWRDVEVSLHGTFLMTRALLPGMLAKGRGRIVNVSSYAGTRPSPYQSGYAAAKAGVLSFTESLAAALAETPLRAFAISPGFVRTALTDELVTSEEGRRWLPELAIASEVPADRTGSLVVMLASGEADALHGRFLHALDDVDDLLAHSDEVARDDLYVMRLRK
jgi:NAD(P)-dependent dehydrogenase (short-subunit alcohol dehydrogenase family)